jgi:hypothetical protein
MTTPNQLTACAAATLQGVYRPEVRMYNEEAHPRYGHLKVSYFFKGRTRSRKDALATAGGFLKQAAKMTPTEVREFLLANCTRSK